ncbi:MAG: AMP-binding protein, partial [Actinobacteria bacterium]|nr:AMP-binding protein [Actinomycetota bacterium]
MFERTEDATHASLRAGFRWSLPDRFNIGAACADVHAATALAMIEIVDGDVREHTFGQVTERSGRVANALVGLGIARGDRVGVLLPQGLDVAVAHLAVYKLGAVAVPLTQLFGPEAVRHRLADSGAKAVLTDATTLDMVAEVAAELGDVTVIVTGSRAAAPHHALDDLLASASARVDVAPTGPDDPAVLIYTSGTTGAPKGALHGHRVLFGHLPGFELMFDLFPQGEDRMWTPADWAWIGGLLDALLPTWFHGRPIVAAPGRRFDPEWAVDLMVDHRVTTTFLPPTALKLMRQADIDGGGLRLRSVMSGGEPLGGEMLAWGREHLGVTVNEIYGQTEANLLVGNSADIWDVRAGSMGRPFPGHDLAILRSDGTIADPEQDGEIVVRAPDPVMMLGYWGQPEATERKYVDVAREGGSDRWLRTGDLGRVDGDGYFWFTSRDDDVIISAGYRIGPAEIEECILG